MRIFTWWAKCAISSEKDSAEQISLELLVTSLGEEVANSHFSKISASSGNSGWLKWKFNSHAGGMAVQRPYGFEKDFVSNSISGSAAWFLVIIFKFIFTPIFAIKIHVKKFPDTEIWFSKPDFYKAKYI